MLVGLGHAIKALHASTGTALLQLVPAVFSTTTVVIAGFAKATLASTKAGGTEKLVGFRTKLAAGSKRTRTTILWKLVRILGNALTGTLFCGNDRYLGCWNKSHTS